MSQPLDPTTLPPDDNVNPYAYCISLRGEYFLQKGAMVAYYGQMRFEPLMAASVSGLVAQRFSSPLYTRDWVVASGQGALLVGDRGYDINAYDLEAGNLTIKASNLLGFEPQLALKQSIVPGFLTLLGTGKFLASSNGPVMFVEPPVRVDPEALLGWADCPSPSHHFDAGWMSGFLAAAGGMLGRQSGEERQFDFTGAGTVLVQSSEVVREDPQLLQMVEEQTQQLAVPQLQQLHRSIGQRLAAQQ